MKSESTIRLMSNYLVTLSNAADDEETKQFLVDCAETLAWALSEGTNPEIPKAFEGELFEMLMDYEKVIAAEHN